MNCRIVDGDNEKLRSVCFEEIEKIVDDKYQKTLEQYDDTDGEYETDNVNDNDILCLKMDYEINYLKKDLIHIMKYYNLSTRKKTKENCIDDIIEFEIQQENEFVVEHRKTRWFYLEELQNDEYLSKFININ
jgi:hypothetical protein|tara:strand:+ start:47 stop:442 length:396 start_codon:yes stop_codon:yes gene_type:complete